MSYKDYIAYSIKEDQKICTVTQEEYLKAGEKAGKGYYVAYKVPEAFTK